MTKINFKEFQLFTDIAHEGQVQIDARREFANAMYMNLSGIVVHDLAFRILRSEGAIELSEEDESLIVEMAKMCKPVFYDSLMAALERP